MEPDKTEEDFALALPKAELHVHIEGTIEPEHYLELVEKNQLDSPYKDADAVRQRLSPQTDLTTFIEVYEELVQALRTPEDFEDAIWRYAQTAHQQGVYHAEMFIDVQIHTARGIELSALMGALRRGKQRVEAAMDMSILFIACFNRDKSVTSAMQHLELLKDYESLIVGIGLDNPEVIDFPKLFAPVFERAKMLGFRLTTHLDVDVPNTLAHHWGALHLLNVERMDHGLNIRDDAELIAAVHSKGLAVTACPTLLYAEIPGRLEYRCEAIRQLLEAGIAVTINSDDPGLMRGMYLGDIYRACLQTGLLTPSQLLQSAQNSISKSWASDMRKEELLSRHARFVGSSSVAATGG